MARIKADDAGFLEHIEAIRGSLNETLDNNTEAILNRLNESPVTRGKTTIVIAHSYSKKAPEADLTFTTEAIHPKQRDKRRIQGEDPDQIGLPLGTPKELPADNQNETPANPEEKPKSRRKKKVADED